jgi:hypothetical protein
MPEKATVAKAKKDLRQGKSPTTAAGEFVHEEIEHVRKGKHGARSTKQAIAIGLSKARRAGVPLKPPARGKRSTRQSAARDYRTGQGKRKPRASSSKRSAAVRGALQREGRGAVSKSALSAQAKRAATRRKRRTGGRKTSGK